MIRTSQMIIPNPIDDEDYRLGLQDLRETKILMNVDARNLLGDNGYFNAIKSMRSFLESTTDVRDDFAETDVQLKFYINNKIIYTFPFNYNRDKDRHSIWNRLDATIRDISPFITNARNISISYNEYLYEAEVSKDIEIIEQFHYVFKIMEDDYVFERSLNKDYSFDDVIDCSFKIFVEGVNVCEYLVEDCELPDNSEDVVEYFECVYDNVISDSIIPTLRVDVRNEVGYHGSLFFFDKESFAIATTHLLYSIMFVGKKHGFLDYFEEYGTMFMREIDNLKDIGQIYHEVPKMESERN